MSNEAPDANVTVLAVFRSRLRPGAGREYSETVERMSATVSAMPGHVAHKTFVADDGERVTIAEFATNEALEAWGRDPAHLAAKRRGVEAFYSEYRIQVCEVRWTRVFKRSD